MHITTSIIDIADARTTSSISAVPMTAGTTVLMMVYVIGTLLEGVASTLVVIEAVLIVDVVSDGCDDGVSAEYVDTVEQFIRNTVSSEPQHISFSLLQIAQGLALANVILMSDGVSVSTVHHLTCPAVMVLL